MLLLCLPVLPIFAFLVLAVAYLIIYLYKRMCLAIPAYKRHLHYPQLIACLIISACARGGSGTAANALTTL